MTTYADRDGWTAERSSSSIYGNPRATINGPDGDNYLVSGDHERLEIDIASYSPCFHLQDDQSPHGGY